MATEREELRQDLRAYLGELNRHLATRPSTPGAMVSAQNSASAVHNVLKRLNRGNTADPYKPSGEDPIVENPCTAWHVTWTEDPEQVLGTYTRLETCRAEIRGAILVEEEGVASLGGRRRDEVELERLAAWKGECPAEFGSFTVRTLKLTTL